MERKKSHEVSNRDTRLCGSNEKTPYYGAQMHTNTEGGKTDVNGKGSSIRRLLLLCVNWSRISTAFLIIETYAVNLSFFFFCATFALAQVLSLS